MLNLVDKSSNTWSGSLHRDRTVTLTNAYLSGLCDWGTLFFPINELEGLRRAANDGRQFIIFPASEIDSSAGPNEVMGALRDEETEEILEVVKFNISIFYNFSKYVPLYKSAKQFCDYIMLGDDQWDATFKSWYYSMVEFASLTFSLWCITRGAKAADEKYGDVPAYKYVTNSDDSVTCTNLEEVKKAVSDKLDYTLLYSKLQIGLLYPQASEAPFLDYAVLFNHADAEDILPLFSWVVTEKMFRPANTLSIDTHQFVVPENWNDWISIQRKDPDHYYASDVLWVLGNIKSIDSDYNTAYDEFIDEFVSVTSQGVSTLEACLKIMRDNTRTESFAIAADIGLIAAISDENTKMDVYSRMLDKRVAGYTKLVALTNAFIESDVDHISYSDIATIRATLLANGYYPWSIVAFNGGTTTAEELGLFLFRSVNAQADSEDGTLDSFEYTFPDTGLTLNADEIIDQMRGNLHSGVAAVAALKAQLAPAGERVASFTAHMSNVFTEDMADLGGSFAYFKDQLSKGLSNTSFVDGLMSHIGMGFDEPDVDPNTFSVPANSDFNAMSGGSPAAAFLAEETGSVVKQVCGTAWNVVKGIGKSLWNAGKSLVQKGLDYLDTTFNDPFDIVVVDSKDTSYTMTGYSIDISHTTSSSSDVFYISIDSLSVPEFIRETFEGTRPIEPCFKHILNRWFKINTVFGENLLNITEIKLDHWGTQTIVFRCKGRHIVRPKMMNALAFTEARLASSCGSISGSSATFGKLKTYLARMATINDKYADPHKDSEVLGGLGYCLGALMNSSALYLAAHQFVENFPDTMKLYNCGGGSDHIIDVNGSNPDMDEPSWSDRHERRDTDMAMAFLALTNPEKIADEFFMWCDGMVEDANGERHLSNKFYRLDKCGPFSNLPGAPSTLDDVPFSNYNWLQIASCYDKYNKRVNQYFNLSNYKDVMGTGSSGTGAIYAGDPTWMFAILLRIAYDIEYNHASWDDYPIETDSKGLTTGRYRIKTDEENSDAASNFLTAAVIAVVVAVVCVAAVAAIAKVSAKFTLKKSQRLQQARSKQARGEKLTRKERRAILRDANKGKASKKLTKGLKSNDGSDSADSAAAATVMVPTTTEIVSEVGDIMLTEDQVSQVVANASETLGISIGEIESKITALTGVSGASGGLSIAAIITSLILITNKIDKMEVEGVKQKGSKPNGV